VDEFLAYDLEEPAGETSGMEEGEQREEIDAEEVFGKSMSSILQVLPGPNHDR
jgi:hypothetical protein